MITYNFDLSYQSLLQIKKKRPKIDIRMRKGQKHDYLNLI